MTENRGSKLARMLVTTLGLSLLWPYGRGFYLEFLTTTIEHPGVASQAAFAAYSAVFALCALLVACMGARIVPSLRAPGAPAVIGVAGALGHLAIWLPAPFPISLALCIVGAALMAVCFVALLLRYAEALVTDSPRTAALACFASFGLCASSITSSSSYQPRFKRSGASWRPSSPRPAPLPRPQQQIPQKAKAPPPRESERYRNACSSRSWYCSHCFVSLETSCAASRIRGSAMRVPQTAPCS